MADPWGPIPIKRGGTDGTTPFSARRALGISQGVSSGNLVTIQDFGWRAGQDNTTAWQRAIDEADGRPIYDFMGGTNVITSTLSRVTTSSSVLVQGLQIFGAGEKTTIFDNHVANGPMLSLDTNTTAKFQQGVRLSGFGIITTISPASSIAIKIRRCFQVDLEHIDISGMTSDGIRFEINQGDGDGSVNCTLRHCHINACAGWGINGNISAGLNEFSLLVLEDTRVETCGTTSASNPPPSGGIKWRGQVINLRDGGCVTNENIGLYVVGGAGLGNTLTVDRWAFENNKKKHCLIEGINNAAFRDFQLYSNDSFIATDGIKMDGTSSTIRNVTIERPVIRISSGNNAFTAFTTTGANVEEKTVSVENPSWTDFDHAGQVRYSGNMVRQEFIPWTPVLSFSTVGNLVVVYSVQTGLLTRDRYGIVRAQFAISTSTFTFTTASGPMLITGLPFTADATANSFGVGTVQWQGITKAGFTDVSCRIAPTDNRLSFQIAGSAQNLADVSATDTPSGGTVILRGEIAYKSS